MTWKLYALTSGGAVLVTALATLVSPGERRSNSPVIEAQAVDRAAAVDLGAQADRLKARLAEVTAYRQPARDAFQFGLPPRRAEATPSASTIEAPPAVVAPVRPPYGFAGLATSTENGVTVRTAILSSLQGVSLVKEGETLDTGYRVTSITDDAVTLESTTDSTQTTLHLSNADQSR